MQPGKGLEQVIKQACQNYREKETFHSEPPEIERVRDELQEAFQIVFNRACNELDDNKRGELTQEAYEVLQEYNEVNRAVMMNQSSTRKVLLMALTGGK